jgi:multidrug efflux pump subunit AcrB
LRNGAFRRLVELAVSWRYATLAFAVAALILSLGLLAGGRVAFQFFPAPESDTVFGNIVMAPGTPREVTTSVITELEEAMKRAEAKLTNGQGQLVAMSFAKVGVSQGAAFRTIGGDNLAGLHIELVPSDQRSIRTETFVRAWREEVRSAPGLERVSLQAAQGGPPGRELDIRLAGASAETLKAASLELRKQLDAYAGVADLQDDLPYGKPELVIEVTSRGRSLGFTTESVSRQIRDAFEGRIALRFARGDEEVSVRVQHGRDLVAPEALRQLYLRAPSGAEVPLSAVVRFEEQAGFARIKREDGRREVSIQGEIDESVTSSQSVLAALERDVLPELVQRFGVEYVLAGRAAEQARTLADLQRGAAIALVGIYLILAWVFASYLRPLVVMTIIPFGLVGAIFGHLVMGYDLTVLSLISLLGLAGVLVNDSIILVSTIDERRKAGEPMRDAVVKGTQDRFRAVLLTSLTTIGGLSPLMFETSLQARFMIPMAVTIVFGLALATLLVLFLVPALIAIQEDAVAVIGRLKRGRDLPEVPGE